MASGIDRLKSQMVAALVDHLAKREERPQVPEAGALLWNAFLDLDSTRVYAEQGPEPITFAMVETWTRVKGYPLAAHHVDILRAMDSALIGRFQDERRRRENEAAKKSGAKRKMGPALFDARFK